MPRRVPTVLTMCDIREICAKASPATLAQSGVISHLRPAFTGKLRGTALLCTLDSGAVLEVRFSPSGNELAWHHKDGPWQEETCECLESSAEGVYLVHYLRSDTMPYGAVTLIVDKKSALVTIVEDQIGTALSNRDVKRTVEHGYIGDTDPLHRHTKTDELVGVILDWRFADDVVIHAMYETIQCCAFVSPPPASAPDWYDFFITFNPTRYRKVADKLYLVSFYAPGNSGMEATMLMDLNHMQAVGAVFGIDHTDTLRSYTFGAKGAYAPIGFIGSYTI
jgi:hypothetical protein